MKCDMLFFLIHVQEKNFVMKNDLNLHNMINKFWKLSLVYQQRLVSIHHQIDWVKMEWFNHGSTQMREIHLPIIRGKFILKELKVNL